MIQQLTPTQHEERKRLALAASWEIDSIVRHLNATLPMDIDECVHVRALAVRIRRLNSVAMSILDNDHGRSNQELADVVEGVA